MRLVPFATRTAALAMLAALAACGGGGGGGGGNGGGGPTPGQNRAPVFTSAASATVPENTQGTFYSATASDADNDAVTFSISGGTDRARFAITGAGALSFVQPPDFEQPADANGDNVYAVQVTAADGRGGNATLNLSVAVTDVTSAAFRVRRVTTQAAQPLYLVGVPDASGRVFVVERAGRIRLLDPARGTFAPLPFLDIADEVSTDGERGLLGFAPAPDFASSGRFYVFMVDLGGTIEIRRYATLAADRDRAAESSADTILRIPHPTYTNHYGGWIDFGNDGLLYIATGDGGGAGDPDNNAQNRDSLLGKILRIDVSGDAFPNDANRDYAIPAGNPFAAGPGADEVFATGLRNPFRNGFDRANGNLYIGDVGQGAREEIDLLRPSDAGANFGWPILEGTLPYRGGSTAGLTPPVAEYAHGTGPREGRSVTGGYVYRGPVEPLVGQYVFSDFVRPNLWSLPAASLVTGTTQPSSAFALRNADLLPDAGTYGNIVSFGQDRAGNLYILDFDGEIFVVEPVPGTSPVVAAPTQAQAPRRPRTLREILAMLFARRG